MGSRHSKFEDECEYLPCTPTLTKHEPITVNTDFNDVNILDPRSPNMCRTPLNGIIDKQKRENPVQELHNQPSSSLQFMDNTTKYSLFKKKFFKGLSYNLNDPRSPSLLLNRTPIVLEDEKSFNMDDTFSDLFVENSEQCLSALMNNVLLKDEDNEIVVKPDIHEIKLTPQTQNEETIVEGLQCDPRSPSIGVERTPIILSDDTPDEDFMIENALEKLSSKETQRKPHNKPLERVKNNKCSSNNKKSSTNHIYEDGDQIFSTPKTHKNFEHIGVRHDSPNQSKRTPLKCVANKSFSRSKSVENSKKSRKTKLPLRSYDDNNVGLEKLQKKIFFGVENEENSFEIR